MTTTSKKKAVAVVRHYFYAALSSAWALYVSGNTNGKDLAIAALSGLIGPAIGYVDPNNTTYGVGSSAS